MLHSKCLKMIFLLLSLLLPLTSNGDPVRDMSNPWYPVNVVQKNGTQRPEKILEWGSDPKNIPSDWKKIDNKYFTASYPKCINVSGNMEETYDPKNSEVIEFELNDCKGYEKSDPTSGLEVGHFQQYLWYLNAKNTGRPTLLVQKLKIDKRDAKLFLSVQGSGPDPQKNIQLRWEVVTMCKDQAMLFTSESEPGQQTVDLIEKKAYEFPEFFRKILETFHCK